MFDFKLLSLAHLKRIASYYNKHIQIKGVSKMSKEDLIKNLEIHLFINELGEIKLKDHSNMIIPKNPKNKSETLKDDIKRTKKLVKSLEKFNQLQKSSESEKEFPKEFKEYVNVLREIKKYSIKFFGTKVERNPKYVEFEKKRLEVIKDLDGIEDLNRKDNRLFFNKMKRKYEVKTDIELIRLYKHFEDSPMESYIKDYYRNDLSKWLDLLKEWKDLRKDVYNLYGDFKEGHNYINKIIQDENLKESNLTGYGMNSDDKGFAIHAVLIDKSIPFEEAFKEAQNIIKKKKFFHRESKNQYRFRNIAKQKFEPRSFKSKKVNENLTLVFGKLKPEHSHLEGAGIFDWLKSKASGAISAVKEYFKPRLDGYNNISKKTIEQYGNMPIKQLFILRTPISGGLNKVINFVSLGKWEELKKKYAFDSLFHLSLVALLENGKNIIIEKNDVVNISPEYKMYPTSETVDIPISNDLTINKLLETARSNVGDNTFFSYDAFKNNCQFFIRYLLEGQNLYTEQAKNFLFQDLENIYNELPSYVPKVMKGATTLGAITNKILGKGKDKIIMNPDAFIKEHQKLITLLRQFDIPKLTVEANEQAKELKKETGIDLTGGKKKKIYH